MRLTMLMLALCAVLVAGCCSADPAPAAPGATPDPMVAGEGLDLQPVIAKPVNGWCIYVPILDCYVCLGVDCGTPKPLIQGRVFGQPVERPAAFGAPEDCEPVYAAPDPCGSASEPYCPDCDVPAWGSASDAGFDYGTPPDLAR